jgi:hypothetical protein
MPVQAVRVLQGAERSLAALPTHSSTNGRNTMSAEKINGTPPSSTEAAPAPGSGDVGQERVLGEISHELGNFFHKLYYWAEFLQETRTAAADGTAVQMLERTIRSLEDFLRASLEFFHPAQLSCVAMPVDELVGALLAPLRAELNGTPVTVADDVPGAGRILVDPVRLSRAWTLVTRELVRGIAPGTCLCIATTSVTCGERPAIRVGFALRGADGTAALPESAMDGVEWAFAERIVALHGGALVRGAAGADTVALVLPLQS